MRKFRLFERDLELSIRDGFLDEKEQDVLLRRAQEFELQEAEAERHLYEICVANEVVIEQVAKQRLSELVQIAADQGVVDRRIREVLVQRGRDLFRQAPDGEQRVETIIAKQLEAIKALEEDELRSQVEKKLRRISKGSFIALDQWRRLYDELAQDAPMERLEVLLPLLCDARDALGLDLIDAPAEDDRPPEDEEPVTTSVSRSILYGVLFGLPLAFLVFLGLMALNRSDSGAAGLGLPACEEQCASRLIDEIGELQQALAAGNTLTPSGRSVADLLPQVLALCRPLLDLSPQIRSFAVEAYPGWTQCESPALTTASALLERELLAEAGLQRGEVACSAIRRCLAIVVDSEACKSAWRERGCT